jgi:tight adherence protein B
MRRLLASAALAVAALAFATSSASAEGAHVALGGESHFPARTLVVSGVGGRRMTTSSVHITENGQPVSADSAESLSNGRRGDLGVVLVIDRSPSMTGAPSQDALEAARSLAAQRSGNQELGIVSFDASATVDLPLTDDSAAITGALQQLPPIGPGTHILPALSLAIRQLAAARVAAGAVILLSDGADREPIQQLTPQSVAAQARAAHVQIFTVGLRDKYYTPGSMRQLAQIGGGEFTEALGGAQLQRIFTGIESRLASSWLIRYRSTQPLGRRISVVLRIDGVPGLLSLSYVSPPAPRLNPRPAARHLQQPFWNSTPALILVAAICALLLCIPVWVLLRQRSGPGGVSERVSGFVTSPPDDPTVVSSLADAAARRTRATFSKSSWWPAFVEGLDIAMVEQTPERLILHTVLGACLMAVLVWLLLGSALAAALPLFAAPFALRAFVQFRVRRQRDRFTDLLPAHLEEVAVSIRVGRSLVEALNVVAEGADEPVHHEFERALRDENLGRPLEDTLRVIAERMTSESIEQVAVVAAMHRSTGSSVSEALDRVAEGARERADVQRELRALTAQGRLARWILTFLPPVILLIMELISPQYVRPLLHTAGGIVSLAVAGVMVIAGSLVMKRIVNIEV